MLKEARQHERDFQFALVFFTDFKVLYLGEYSTTLLNNVFKQLFPTTLSQG